MADTSSLQENQAWGIFSEREGTGVLAPQPHQQELNVRVCPIFGCGLSHLVLVAEPKVIVTGTFLTPGR